VGVLKDMQSRGGVLFSLRQDESAIFGYADPDPDGELYEYELKKQGQQDRYRSELIETGVAELDGRLDMMRGRGRPATLSAYKRYKRDYLKYWTRFITARAKQLGMVDRDLCDAFHFTNAVELRELRRGSENCHRVNHLRFKEYFVKVVRQKRLEVLRNGGLVIFLNTNFMSQEEFVNWIRTKSNTTNLPQISHVSVAVLN